MTGQIVCPRCQTANAAEARFCANCGGVLGAAPPPQSPPMPQAPPPMPPPMPTAMRIPGMAAAGGAGPTGQGVVALDQANAFQAALNAIAAAGGAVTWQNPPTTGKFSMVRKSFWSTGGTAVTYAGDLVVQQTASGQSGVTLSLKINWNSYLPFALTSLIVGLVAIVFQGWGVMFLLLVLAGVGMSAYTLSNAVPESLLKTILANLGAGPVGAPIVAGPVDLPGAAPAYQPAPQTAPPPAAAPAPAPVRILDGAAPAPVPAPAGAAPAPAMEASATAPPPAEEADDSASDIMDQIKQLAGLRDVGAITPEEFEAKKAEMLGRL